jgi:uncharacterized protein
MPVQPTYPGVYIQELSSGVHTITGVSTSIALFIGRTIQGPVNTPVSCSSYSDYVNAFSDDTSLSDMARSVRLFFLNGGNLCYVSRIGHNALASTVTLNNAAGAPVLLISAKSQGQIGNQIRLSVDYNTSQPESTFNMTIFQWTKNSGGQLVKSNIETWKQLSMNPLSPRYANAYLTQNSNLVNAALPTVALPAPINGYSQSGRPFNPATIGADIATIAGTGGNIQINVNGNGFNNVPISGIVAADTLANVCTKIAAAINAGLPVADQVTVTAPIIGTLGHARLHIECTTGDVNVITATSLDLSAALMLGTLQGGTEVSRYAALRPVPNGIVFDPSLTANLGNLIQFGDDISGAFDTLNINSTPISLTGVNKITTGANMYIDAYPSTVNGHNDGIREKWNIIANAVNTLPPAVPPFNWTAQVWGSRLALIPGDGNDNSVGTISTSGAAGTDIGTLFTPSTRYYTLGLNVTNPKPAIQNGTDGSDGSAPLGPDYDTAYSTLDPLIDLFNLLILNKDTDSGAASLPSLYGAASAFCQLRRAFLIMDPPDNWSTFADTIDPAKGVNNLRIGLVTDHSAVYFPRLIIQENNLPVTAMPSGAIAGLMSRTDANRGVWKAPAGTAANFVGILGLDNKMTDSQNGQINPQAVNALRIFPDGVVSWGARTMEGFDDSSDSDWKYIPVRRTALFIEESLYRGLKWVVFEPNSDPLWSQIRLSVGAFMHGLFIQGAFAGTTRDTAYFVACDSTTTSQDDIDNGIVNIVVGFAPLKPAEFVIVTIQQLAGQIQV